MQRACIAEVVGPPGTPYSNVPFFFDMSLSPQCAILAATANLLEQETGCGRGEVSF